MRCDLPPQCLRQASVGMGAMRSRWSWVGRAPRARSRSDGYCFWWLVHKGWREEDSVECWKRGAEVDTAVRCCAPSDVPAQLFLSAVLRAALTAAPPATGGGNGKALGRLIGRSRLGIISPLDASKELPATPVSSHVGRLHVLGKTHVFVRWPVVSQRVLVSLLQIAVRVHGIFL
jgi:hypothetical protein